MAHLDQLQTFLVVANTLNFSEAGRRLSLPRATVSARIKALELRLNTQLFLRSTRKVALTQEGAEYFLVAERLLNELNIIEESFMQRSYLQGQIRLSVPVEFPQQSLVSLLADFAQLHPKVTVQIVVTDKALNLVADRIDIAFRGRSVTTQDLIARKLGETPLLLLASPSYCNRHSALIKAGDWHKLAVLDPLRLIPFAAATPPVDTTSMALARSFAQSGTAIALLPKQFCTDQISSAVLESITSPSQLPRLPVYLVYASGNRLAKRVRTLKDFIWENRQKYHLV
ncbi:MAG: LysR family transcriptional regulator [Pseudomonadales bacterium]|nr:LysR family transcriptional regulator [Pseudomonadales bacterium]NRA18334.1 LysR family transcriptional regulator [Oceanospirillaceae bacterium]